MIANNLTKQLNSIVFKEFIKHLKLKTKVDLA